MEFTREVMEALGAPFPDDEIEFLPRATSGGKALGLAYIDARSVMRRLDAVVGPGNWTFDFDVLSPDGKMVKGRLSVLGVMKCDAGESNAEDEPLKSAVSDALKRCAVHFGIGRYLYYLPRVWAPFDPQKRQFVEPPRLAPAAIERALAICGIPTTRTVGNRHEPSPAASSAGAPGAGAQAGAPRSGGPHAGAAQARAPQNGVPQNEGAQNGAGARKSIWAAGAAPGAPESSGDRAAATRPAPERRAVAPEVRSAAPENRPASETRQPAPETAGALVCSRDDCGKALTKGQHDVSVRAFGQPLCPACQKLVSRSA